MQEKEYEGGAKSELLDLGISQIPLVSLLEIGRRFKKGELRYGRDNWKVGGEAWLRERFEHAIKHLYEYGEQTSGEDSPIENLSAVAWFAIIAIWHEQQKAKIIKEIIF
jgi:hypothetical protein